MEGRDLAGAPVPPADFEPLYNSYVTDPIFARRFTWVWVAGTLAVVVLYSPKLLSGLRSGRIWQGWAIYERFNHGYRPLDYEPTEEKGSASRRPGREALGPSPAPVARRLSTLVKGAADFVQLRVIKGLDLDIGQIIVLTAYLVTLLVCVIYQAPLISNSNRAGFLSLAQLPFVFLYAAKSSPLTLLLGRGYEKLNFLHRWAGRALFLTATIHGSLWINFYIRNNQAYILVSEDKERRGEATYALLCLIVLGSLKPVRRYAYNYFYAFHTVVTTAFFISLCYHTPYAVPWVIPPVAFYTFDFLVRLIRMRFKDAYLEAPDNLITLIHIPDVSGGWIAGQHVRIRIFFDGRVFEQHPLSILNAPPTISTFANYPSNEKADFERYGSGIILAARNCGDWSGALNRLARSELPEDKGSAIALLPVSGEHEGHEEMQEFESTEGRRVGVMIDGPFGGPSIDFAQSENVVLISGGSGATFTIGILDDIVGRVVLDRRLGKATGNVRTRKVLFVWCIKSYGAILWFKRQFQAIAKAASDPSLDLEVHFRFFVTCYCSPEDLPPLRNSNVSEAKPVVRDVLREFIGDVVASNSSRGGLAVAASGPERLTSETRNAVADIGPFMASRLGGVELHTEAYCL
ncbi:hypothetical protein M407DRAFT_245747 [Tulasnella calospora MUT 4182]|uniref:FAD-binding FR-type domain-containing protein n=1 Tax=Tulasnella calospora MUT 4182 TaxID=1051891 RepID=A0A0C3Q8F9_9AGAM|nr:hypothetical protein M407DRAFT_245747 [Tulasnella calospora MUT 4182]